MRKIAFFLVRSHHNHLQKLLPSVLWLTLRFFTFTAPCQYSPGTKSQPSPTQNVGTVDTLLKKYLIPIVKKFLYGGQDQFDGLLSKEYAEWSLPTKWDRSNTSSLTSMHRICTLAFHILLAPQLVCRWKSVDDNMITTKGAADDARRVYGLD